MTGQMSGSAEVDDFIAARSRYVKDELAAAMARGATQYVVLGVGVDTFDYCGADSRLRTFVVDYPDAHSGEVAFPASVTFVPTDFERQPLGSALGNAGFADAEISFFSWLGVTPYPTAEAALAALSFIGSRPEGSSVVFDYAVERSSHDSVWRMAMDAFASRFARAGEPSRLFLDSRALNVMLRAAGFQEIEDLGPADIDRRYFTGQAGAAGFAHLVNARV